MHHINGLNKRVQFILSIGVTKCPEFLTQYIYVVMSQDLLDRQYMIESWILETNSSADPDKKNCVLSLK